jgi:hypothetical protein
VLIVVAVWRSVRYAWSAVPASLGATHRGGGRGGGAWGAAPMRLLALAGLLALVLFVPFVASSKPAAAGGPPPPHPFPGGGLFAYGDARPQGSPTNEALAAPMVAMATDRATGGYWLVGADGGVFAYDAPFYGSAATDHLWGPIVAISPYVAPPATGLLTATATTLPGQSAGLPTGYWLAGADGGVFSFGQAPFYGSAGCLNPPSCTSSVERAAPIVGIAEDDATGGYWLAGADGGVLSFGAPFDGSAGCLNPPSCTSSVEPAAPIVGIAATPDGKGYWLVGADGGVFAFGDAGFFGSAANDDLNASIVGIAATPDGKGYWLVGADGGVFSFGDAGFFGSHAGAVPTPPVVGIAPTPDGNGYLLLDPDGFSYSFAAASNEAAYQAGPTIVTWAASQIGPDPDSNLGAYCNPYGPCEPWCALFATWAWEQAGVPIPRYAFVGDVYTWALQHGVVLSPNATPAPGDVVLYGTGPYDPATAVHMAVVALVWPDGAIVTVDGDAGPGPWGLHDVDLNGPFLPADSSSYNGVPIFAFARP